MSRLVAHRTHLRRMATAQHKPECPWSRPADCKPRPQWGFVYGEDGRAHGLVWQGMSEPPPACDGCITDDERALWKRLADEADAYAATQTKDGAR